MKAWARACGHRALVNGASFGVSALRASIPRARSFIATVFILAISVGFAHGLGERDGYHRGETEALSDILFSVNAKTPSITLESRVREGARICTDERWANRVDARSFDLSRCISHYAITGGYKP